MPNVAVVDPSQVDKLVDMIEESEYKIHNGIATGRFEEEDKHSDDQDTDEDNYGKMLLQVNPSIFWITE